MKNPVHLNASFFTKSQNALPVPKLNFKNLGLCLDMHNLNTLDETIEIDK